MAGKENPYGMGTYIMLILFLGLMIGGSYALINTPGFRPATLIVPVILFLLYYLKHHEYLYLFHFKKFVFKSGVSATLEGNIDYNQPGGAFKVTLWLKKRVYDALPGKDGVHLVTSGFMGGIAWLTRDVRLVFYGSKNKLVDLAANSELPEGHFFYEGSLSGFDIPTEHERLHALLERQNLICLSHINTLIAVKQKVSDLSKSSNKDLRSAVVDINLMLKNVQEAREPYQQQNTQFSGGGRSMVGGIPGQEGTQ